jgi:hypothetical protein
LDPDTAGDPMSSRRWTDQTTEKVAQQLHRLGICVGARTLARLLDRLHFSLRVNCKKIAPSVQTVRAYLLKEDFQQFWKYNSPYWAGMFLDFCALKRCARASSP